MYKIEKGIEIPECKHGGGKNRKYPFDEMDVGDSFFVPVIDPTKDRLVSRASSILASTRAKRLQNRKFSSNNAGWYMGMED